MLSKKMGARLFLLLMAATLSTVVLAACEDNSEVITLEFTIRNETEYEIQKIIFVGDNSSGRGQPFLFYNIVDTEAEYREDLYNSVDGTFYSGYDAESIEPLSAGEERVFTISLREKILNSPWGVDVEAFEVVLGSNSKSLALNENVKGFVVFYAEETEFVFAPFYQ